MSIPPFLAVMLAACALSGCCSTGSRIDLRQAPLAWDGLGAPPGGATRPVERKRPVATLEAAPSLPPGNPHKPYSKEWWAIEDQRARGEDARMARLLVICRSCGAQAGSPAAASAADGRQGFAHLTRSGADNELPSGTK